MKLPPSDRTNETEQKYQDAKREGKLIPLLEVETKMRLSEVWNLKDNGFPYDAKWEISEMGVLNRKLDSIRELSDEEKIELVDLIADLQETSGSVKFNGQSRSVLNTPHFHVLSGEKERGCEC